MCLTNTSAERIVNDMFSYVEETWQLETYLIRKDPVTITGNSKHLAEGSISPSHSNPLIHTQISHSELFNYRKYHIYV